MSTSTDKIRTTVACLPKGWVREVVMRKSGATAGKSDVYYYSPEGKKCRSKVQMTQYLPDDFEIDNFDFKVGKNSESNYKRVKKRKDDFNYGKDFSLSGSEVKPSRQTKKARENIKVQVINKEVAEVAEEQIKKPASRAAETDAKKRRAENLSTRCSKPKQLFWQKRLQHMKPMNEKTMEACPSAQLDSYIKDLLPNSNNQALLNSLWYSLFSNIKVSGQHASMNALRKHPTALCNPEQPFTAPFTITDDILRAQEKKVEAVRKKLTEAHELLAALEDEEDEDADDMEE